MPTDHGDERSLAQRMGQLALELGNETDKSATLHAIVAAALDLVPAARWAGVSLIVDRRVVPQAGSDPLVTEIDQLQSTLGEGPALSAIQTHHTVRVDDLSTLDERWPRFAERAVELGVRSMLSMRLFARERDMGALNLYADTADAFSVDAEILADLICDHAAIALAGATREEHLNTALINRDILGQAKGILMSANRITAHQAFALLVRASQELNIKAVDAARQLVDDNEDDAQHT